MAMFEASSRIQSNHTTSYVLSTQDIVSCSEYSQGCEGGNPFICYVYCVDGLEHAYNNRILILVVIAWKIQKSFPLFSDSEY